MGALQVLVFVASAVLVLENGSWKVEGAPRVSYAYTTHHRPSSAGNTITSSATNPSHRTAAQSAGTRRDEFSVSDYRRYMPVEDTPEVKKAREQFFTLYEKQAKLAAEAKDDNHIGNADDDYYYYYDDLEDEDEYEYEEEDDDDEDEEDEDGGEDSEEEEDEDEEDDDEEEGEDSEEDEEEEESEEDEDEEDSDEDSSSSSSEEDYDGDDSSEEESGEDSSEEEGDDSSEEEDDSSSSSSSSSSEEEDGEGRGLYQPLNTNLLHTLKPVEDTPEVKEAKRKFFELYKTQAELSFNAPDYK